MPAPEQDRHCQRQERKGLPHGRGGVVPWKCEQVERKVQRTDQQPYEAKAGGQRSVPKAGSVEPRACHWRTEPRTGKLAPPTHAIGAAWSLPARHGEYEENRPRADLDPVEEAHCLTVTLEYRGRRRDDGSSVGALLGTSGMTLSALPDGLVVVAVDQVHPGPLQPRTRVSTELVHQVADSMRAGRHEPLLAGSQPGLQVLVTIATRIGAWPSAPNGAARGPRRRSVRCRWRPPGSGLAARPRAAAPPAGPVRWTRRTACGTSRSPP